MIAWPTIHTFRRLQRPPYVCLAIWRFDMATKPSVFIDGEAGTTA